MPDCKASEIYSVLVTTYGSSHSFIEFGNPFQILILTILSAQTTDRTVNSIRERLFSRYPDPQSLASAEQRDVEEIIKSTGFYHAKAANIIKSSRILVKEFSGEVPQTMAELLRLPGVGRKTANIVLNHAFGINTGIAVDTHVRRLSQRLGLTRKRDPSEIEQDLIRLYPEECWGNINFLLISHGRAVCTARHPDCQKCVIKELCAYQRQLQEESCIDDITDPGHNC